MGTRDQSWRTAAPPRLQPRKENPDLVRIHDRGRCWACRRRHQTQVPGAEVGDTQVVAGTFACMEVRLHRVNVCPCAKPFTYLPLSRHNGSYSCPCPTASKCLGLTCLLMRHGSRGFWRYAIRVVMHGVALTCPPPCCCQVNECPALEGLAHPVCVLVGDYAGVTRLTLTCRRNCAKEWLTTCLGWCSTPCYQPTRHPSSHRRSLVCCPVTTATVGTRRSTSERQVRRLWQPHGMWCMRGTT